MILMLAKALKYDTTGTVDTGFADDEAIPTWAKGAAKAVKDAGIIKGRSGGIFAPEGSASRAEAITTLVKLPIK
jgi:hypothetical protein